MATRRNDYSPFAAYRRKMIARRQRTRDRLPRPLRFLFPIEKRRKFVSRIWDWLLWR